MHKKTMIFLGIAAVVLATVTVVLTGGVGQITGNRILRQTTQSSPQKTPSSIASEDMKLGYAVPPVYPDYIGGGDALNVSQRVYEAYGYFNLVVEDVTGYMQKTKKYVLSLNGKVLNYQTGLSGKFQTGSMTAKIPVDKFDEATRKVTEEVKSIESQQINSTDVTGSVEAINQQLASLEDQKALKQVELLEAKTELEKRRIELEINRLDQQITNVKSQDAAQQERVEYATLNISIASSKFVYNPSGRPDLGSELEKAFNSVLDNIYVIAQFVIWVVVYGLVLTPLVILAGVLKRRSAKKTAKVE